MCDTQLTGPLVRLEATQAQCRLLGGRGTLPISHHTMFVKVGENCYVVDSTACLVRLIKHTLETTGRDLACEPEVDLWMCEPGRKRGKTASRQVSFEEGQQATREALKQLKMEGKDTSKCKASPFRLPSHH